MSNASVVTILPGDCELVLCSSDVDWLAQRLGGIGASESAALFGASKWDSPYSIWARKTGKAPEKTQNSSMRLGVMLEDGIAQAYADQIGMPLIDYGRFALLRSVSSPRLLCTLDRACAKLDGEEGPGVIEIKHTSMRSWQESPPTQYEIQVQHQLAVTGWKWGRLVIECEGEIREHKIARNDQFISLLKSSVEKFWADHVVTLSPPAIDGSKPTESALKEVLGRATGRVVELGADALDLDRESLELDEQLERIETKRRELKNKLLAMIGDASEALLPGGVRYTYKEQTRKATVTKESTYRVLRRFGAKE